MRGATEVLPAGTEIAGWALLIVAPVGGGLDGEAVELDVAADVVVGSNEGVGSVVDVPCAGPEAATELDGPGVASVEPEVEFVESKNGGGFVALLEELKAR